jgi:uronate dehydrogenase
MTRVLITGAAGHIGRALRAGFQGHYALRLADIAPQAEARPSEEIVTADITRLEDLLPIMEGIDVVVHLAGVPDEDRWKAATTCSKRRGKPASSAWCSRVRTMQWGFIVATG